MPNGQKYENWLKSPGPSAYPRRGHKTSERYYPSLMYGGLRTSDTLHKKLCRIGSVLCATSENSVKAKFAEPDSTQVADRPWAIRWRNPAEPSPCPVLGCPGLALTGSSVRW